MRDANQWRIAADTWTAEQPARGSASVRLRQEHGVLLFEATLDGVGPLLFTLDPGGEDVYTSYARERLNKRVPHKVCIAEACVAASLQYFEGEPNELDPQHDRASGILAGNIGPQLFWKYDVRIDYRSSTLTLIPPAQFHPKSGSRALALTSDAYGMPVTEARVDGIASPFELDVRVGTSMLFGPFHDRTGLRRRYEDAPIVQKSGRLEARAVHRVTLAGVELRDVPFWLSRASAGKFANPNVGGLLANNALSGFVVTFDEPDRKVFLERQELSVRRVTCEPRHVRKLSNVM